MDVSGELHEPAASPLPDSGKAPLYLLNRRLGGPQSHCGLAARENSLLLFRESNLDSSVTVPLT